MGGAQGSGTAVVIPTMGGVKASATLGARIARS